MSELASLVGAGMPFSFGGKDLVVKPRDILTEGAFSAWVESEALRVVSRHRDELTPQEYAMSLSSWRQDCGAGLYEWGSPHCQILVESKRGSRHLALLNLQRSNPRAHITPAWVDSLFGDAQARAEYQTLQGLADADPAPEGEEGNVPPPDAA